MNFLMFALLASTIQQAPATGPERSAEVQVIGRKLKNWRANLTSKNGVYGCKVRKSTGDPAIDAIGCAAMTTCFPRFEPRLKATVENKLGVAARKQAQAAISREMTDCMMGQHDKLTEELAERRYRERSGTGS